MAVTGSVKQPNARQVKSDGETPSRDGSEQAAKAKPASEGPTPTAEQIAAAIRNQGEQQVDDLSPRLRRIRAIGMARQGEGQKPRTLSPEEQRAFEIGSQSPKYQP